MYWYMHWYPPGMYIYMGIYLLFSPETGMKHDMRFILCFIPPVSYPCFIPPVLRHLFHPLFHASKMVQTFSWSPGPIYSLVCFIPCFIHVSYLRVQILQQARVMAGPVWDHFGAFCDNLFHALFHTLFHTPCFIPLFHTPGFMTRVS